jgi:hypothetical protein
LRDVRLIAVAGASVFELRARGTAQAGGGIVAWTEDHCRPSADWCERTLLAHARHPEADLIGGAVINGSVDSVIDWANFLCTFAPFLPPLEHPPLGRVPVAANLSLKRRAMPPGDIGPGFIETSVGATPPRPSASSVRRQLRRSPRPKQERASNGTRSFPQWALHDRSGRGRHEPRNASEASIPFIDHPVPDSQDQLAAGAAKARGTYPAKPAADGVSGTVPRRG